MTDLDRGAGALVARVIVNRLWQHHFGRGLVASSNNFGTIGDPPTHPDLLEWLAGELVRQDWSLKSIHRLILTSATYTQGTAWNEEGFRVDPENRLLWRWRTRRLEAENDSRCDPLGRRHAQPDHRGTERQAVDRARCDLHRLDEEVADQRTRRSSHLAARYLHLHAPLDANAVSRNIRRTGRHVEPWSSGNHDRSDAGPSFFSTTVSSANRRNTSPPASKRSVESGAWNPPSRSIGPRRSKPPTGLRFSRAPSDVERRLGQDLLSSPGQTIANLCHALLTLNEFVFVD